MARYEIERPQYTIHPGRGHVRIDNMSIENHSAVMVLSALVEFDGRDGGTPTLEGITGIVNGDLHAKGQLYPEGTVIIQTEGRDDMAEHVDAWFQNYYSKVYEKLSLSTDALSKALKRGRKSKE